MSRALANAKLWILPDRATVRANARSIVALDLGQTTLGRKPTPALYAELPNLPLEALGLAQAGMRAVPAHVSACKALEVLSLHSAGIKTLPDLRPLAALRGLDVQFDKLGDAVARGVGAWSALEILEHTWSALPPEVLESKAIRHLDIADAKGRVKIPSTLDSLVTRGAIAEGDAPLRFFLGDIAALPASSSMLEHVSLHGKGELPVALKGMKRLRALRYVGDAPLPDWLADLELQYLQIDTKRLARTPDAYRVLERMTTLRGLMLVAQEHAALPYDFSALRDLRFFSIPLDSVKEESGFPRGLRELPKLAMVQIDSHRKGPSVEVLRAHLPPEVIVRDDGNMLMRQSPVDNYRAFSAERTSPEWWISRFRVGDVFERIVEIGKLVMGA